MPHSNHAARNQLVVSRDDIDALLTSVYAIEVSLSVPSQLRRWATEAAVVVLLGLQLASRLPSLPDRSPWRDVLGLVVRTCLELSDHHHDAKGPAIPAAWRGARLPVPPNGTTP